MLLALDLWRLPEQVRTPGYAIWASGYGTKPPHMAWTWQTEDKLPRRDVMMAGAKPYTSSP